MEIAGDMHQQTPIKLPDLSKFEVLGNASEAFTFIDPETGERTAPKRALENLAKEADKDIKEHKDIH